MRETNAALFGEEVIAKTDKVYGIDDEGEDSILLEKTTPEEIMASYKARKFPRDTHVPDMLRERVEKKK